MKNNLYEMDLSPYVIDTEDEGTQTFIDLLDKKRKELESQSKLIQQRYGEYVSELEKAQTPSDNEVENLLRFMLVDTMGRTIIQDQNRLQSEIQDYNKRVETYKKKVETENKLSKHTFFPNQSLAESIAISTGATLPMVDIPSAISEDQKKKNKAYIEQIRRDNPLVKNIPDEVLLKWRDKTESMIRVESPPKSTTAEAFAYRVMEDLLPGGLAQSNSTVAQMVRSWSMGLAHGFDLMDKARIDKDKGDFKRAAVRGTMGALSTIINILPPVQLLNLSMPVLLDIGGSTAEKLGYKKETGEKITGLIAPFLFGTYVGMGSFVSEAMYELLDNEAALHRIAALNPQYSGLINRYLTASEEDKELAKEFLSTVMFFVGAEGTKYVGKKYLEPYLRQKKTEIEESYFPNYASKKKVIEKLERIIKDKSATPNEVDVATKFLIRNRKKLPEEIWKDLKNLPKNIRKKLFEHTDVRDKTIKLLPEGTVPVSKPTTEPTKKVEEPTKAPEQKKVVDKEDLLRTNLLQIEIMKNAGFEPFHMVEFATANKTNGAVLRQLVEQVKENKISVSEAANKIRGIYIDLSVEGLLPKIGLRPNEIESRRLIEITAPKKKPPRDISEITENDRVYGIVRNNNILLYEIVPAAEKDKYIADIEKFAQMHNLDYRGTSEGFKGGDDDVVMVSSFGVKPRPPVPASNKIRMYHKSPIEKDIMLLDPNRIGERDLSTPMVEGDTPSVFFYLDPTEVEAKLGKGGGIYGADVDARLIYNANLDKEYWANLGTHPKASDKHGLFSDGINTQAINNSIPKLKELGYKGIAYQLNEQPPIVRYFEPIEAYRLDEVDYRINASILTSEGMGVPVRERQYAEKMMSLIDEGKYNEATRIQQAFERVMQKEFEKELPKGILTNLQINTISGYYGGYYEVGMEINIKTMPRGLLRIVDIAANIGTRYNQEAVLVSKRMLQDDKTKLGKFEKDGSVTTYTTEVELSRALSPEEAVEILRKANISATIRDNVMYVISIPPERAFELPDRERAETFYKKYNEEVYETVQKLRQSLEGTGVGISEVRAELPTKLYILSKRPEHFFSESIPPEVRERLLYRNIRDTVHWLRSEEERFSLTNKHAPITQKVERKIQHMLDDFDWGITFRMKNRGEPEIRIMTREDIINAGYDPEVFYKLNPGEEGYEPGKELYKITINAKYDTSNPAEHIIEYSNRTSIHNLVEEIVHAVVGRLIEENPRIKQALERWRQRVEDRAHDFNLRGAKLSTEELATQIYVFSQGYAYANEFLADISLPKEVVSEINKFFQKTKSGADYLPEIQGEKLVNLSNPFESHRINKSGWVKLVADAEDVIKRKIKGYKPTVTDVSSAAVPYSLRILESITGKPKSKQFYFDLIKSNQITEIERKIISTVLESKEFKDMDKISPDYLKAAVSSYILPLYKYPSKTYATWGMMNVLSRSAYLSPDIIATTMIYGLPFYQGADYGHFSSFAEGSQRSFEVERIVGGEKYFEITDKTGEIFSVWRDRNEAEKELADLRGLYPDREYQLKELKAKDNESTLVIADGSTGEIIGVFRSSKDAQLVLDVLKRPIESSELALFGHTRRWDDIKNNIRYLAELQSDYFQYLDQALWRQARKFIKAKKYDIYFDQLDAYRQHWWRRLINEEIAEATINGLTLRMPTPYTLAKIEGYVRDTLREFRNRTVGETIRYQNMLLVIDEMRYNNDGDIEYIKVVDITGYVAAFTPSTASHNFINTLFLGEIVSLIESSNFMPQETYNKRGYAIFNDLNATEAQNKIMRDMADKIIEGFNKIDLNKILKDAGIDYDLQAKLIEEFNTLKPIRLLINRAKNYIFSYEVRQVIMNTINNIVNENIKFDNFVEPLIRYYNSHGHEVYKTKAPLIQGEEQYYVLREGRRIEYIEQMLSREGIEREFETHYEQALISNAQKTVVRNYLKHYLPYFIKHTNAKLVRDDYGNAWYEASPHKSPAIKSIPAFSLQGDYIRSLMNRDDFKAWFGNSILREADGTPTIFYHGTTRTAYGKEFAQFIIPKKSSAIGIHFGTIDQANEILKHKAYDEFLTAYRDPRHVANLKNHSRIFPVVIRLENPIELPDSPAWEQPITLLNMLYQYRYISEDVGDALYLRAHNTSTSLTELNRNLADGIRNWMKENGFDGFIYENRVEIKDFLESFVLERRERERKIRELQQRYDRTRDVSRRNTLRYQIQREIEELEYLIHEGNEYIDTHAQTSVAVIEPNQVKSIFAKGFTSSPKMLYSLSQELPEKTPDISQPMGAKESTTKGYNIKTMHPKLVDALPEMIENARVEFDELRGRRLTTEQIKDAAVKAASELKDDDILNLKRGDTKNATTTLAMRIYAANRMLEIFDNIKAIPPDINLPASIIEQSKKALKMYMKVRALGTEAARTVRFMAIPESEELINNMRFLRDAMKSKDLDTKVIDTIIRDAEEGRTTTDKIYRWYYEFLLSNPYTDAANIFGNISHLLAEVTTKMLIGEMNPKQLMRAIINGHKEGVRKAVDYYNGVESLDSKFIEDNPQLYNQLKTQSEIVKLARTLLPSTRLAMEDAYFRAVGEEIEATVLKKKMAKQEHVTVDEIEKRIQQVMADPELSDPASQQIRQMLIDIEEYGQHITFQTKLGKRMSAFQHAMNNPIGKLLVPFVRTLYNISKAGLYDWSPLGLTTPLTRKYKEASSQGKKNMLRRAIAGTLFYALLLKLMHDEDVIVTGELGKDQDKKQLLMRMGYKPNHIYVNTPYGMVGVSYQNINPVNGMLAVIGNFSDEMRWGKKYGVDDKTLMEQTSSAISGTIATITDQSFAQGISRFFQYTQSGNKDYLEDLILGATIPNIVSFPQRTKEYIEQYKPIYEAESIVDKIKRKMGMYEGLTPRYDVFGEQMQNPRERFWFLPTKIKTKKIEEMIIEKELNIPYPKKTTKLGDREMTEREFAAYVKLSGKEIFEQLKLRYRDINAMPKEAAQDVVDEIVRSARKRARNKLAARSKLPIKK